MVSPARQSRCSRPCCACARSPAIRGSSDEAWEEAGSAKLEALFDQVSEVLDEGHKVLVFSQFTSLLGYVRRHLDEQEVPYAYLDGKTRRPRRGGRAVPERS